MANAPSGAQQLLSDADAGKSGPRVFLDYDQAELDALYNQANFAPNAAQIHQRTETNSAAARARLGPALRLNYGPTPIESLDVYRSSLEKAPVFVYIHGGSWRTGSAARAAFPAEMFVRAGACYVPIDFTSIDDAGKNLMTLADQVRRALAWVYRNAASFGADPERLYVGGHSSGAHLAGVVLTTDWAEDFGLPNWIVKGGLCCSGMHELHPVSLSARSSFVDFNDHVVQALSAIRRIERIVRLSSPMAPMKVPNSSGRAVILRTPSRRLASPSASSSVKDTITSRSPKPLPIHTDFLGGLRSN